MWPEEQKYPTSAEIREVNERNSNGAAPRGKWADPEFLKTVSERNHLNKNTQFADYHGHEMELPRHLPEGPEGAFAGRRGEYRFPR